MRNAAVEIYYTYIRLRFEWKEEHGFSYRRYNETFLHFSVTFSFFVILTFTFVEINVSHNGTMHLAQKLLESNVRGGHHRSIIFLRTIWVNRYILIDTFSFSRSFYFFSWFRFLILAGSSKNLSIISSYVRHTHTQTQTQASRHEGSAWVEVIFEPPTISFFFFILGTRTACWLLFRMQRTIVSDPRPSMLRMFLS